MTAQWLDTDSTGSALLCAEEKQEELLEASTNHLAFLRYSILLTAKWEASSGRDMKRQDELRAELMELRIQYFNKIDDIAMTFGVQSAMNATEAVERTQAVPSGIDPGLFDSPDQDDDGGR